VPGENLVIAYSFAEGKYHPDELPLQGQVESGAFDLLRRCAHLSELLEHRPLIVRCCADPVSMTDTSMYPFTDFASTSTHLLGRVSVPMSAFTAWSAAR
jgi:hypothetical protein